MTDKIKGLKSGPSVVARKSNIVPQKEHESLDIDDLADDFWVSSGSSN